MQIKICRNVVKNAKICSGPKMSPLHLCAFFLCKKYAITCKICEHENHKQNVQQYIPPTLLMISGLTHGLHSSVH